MFYQSFIQAPAYQRWETLLAPKAGIFLDLGLPVELGFIPPAYGFMSRTGKRSGGVKKEALHQLPGKTGAVGNLNNPERAPNMNILVSFSHSEVQPSEESRR